jgi:hypothetical protein
VASPDRIALASLLALLSAACVESVKIEPPSLALEDGEARAALMIVEEVVPGASPIESILFAWAGELSSSSTLPPFSASPDEHLRIHLWLYASTLDELGLPAGPLTLVGSSERTCRAVGTEVALLDPLPRAASAQLVEVEGGEQSGWMELDAAQQATLEALHLERRVSNPCVTFIARYGTFADTCPTDEGCGRRTVFVAPMTETSAYVGRIQSTTLPGEPEERIGHQYAVMKPDVSDLFHTDTATPAEAGLNVGGELLVLRADGTFSCLRGDGRDCTIDLPAALPTSRHNYSSLARDEDTIYAARDDGAIWRWRDRAWALLRTPEEAPCDFIETCSNTVISGCDLICRPTIRIFDGSVFILLPYLNAAYRLRGDELVRAVLPPFELLPDLPLSGALDSRGRGAIGTTFGRLLLEVEPDLWSHVDSIGQQPVFTVAPIDSGVLFGGEDGVLGQHHPEYGSCAELALPYARITDIVPMGRDFLAFGQRRGDSRRDFVWLERSEQPGDPCRGFIPTQLPE